MFLGEMLMGIDLDGDEPGEASKCMLDILGSVRGGSVYVYTQRSGFVGRKQFCSDRGVRVSLAPRQVDRGENGR